MCGTRCAQAFLVLVFLCGMGLLLYTLRSMTAERVCQPSWAGHPPGVHLNIAIVTMTDTQLQNRKQHNKEKVRRGGS